MKSNITEQQKQDLVAFIKREHTNYKTKLACFRAGVAKFNLPLQTTSSNSNRYLRFAGLSPATRDGAKISAPTSPYQTIHDAERTIRRALSELDTERDALMNRIKEIDNMIAKYKHVTT